MSCKDVFRVLVTRHYDLECTLYQEMDRFERHETVVYYFPKLLFDSRHESHSHETRLTNPFQTNHHSSDSKKPSQAEETVRYAVLLSVILVIHI